MGLVIVLLMVLGRWLFVFDDCCLITCVRFGLDLLYCNLLMLGCYLLFVCGFIVFCWVWLIVLVIVT